MSSLHGLKTDLFDPSNCFFRISSDFHFKNTRSITTKPYLFAANKTDPELYPLRTSADLTDGLQILMFKPIFDERELLPCKEAAFTIHSPFELPDSFDLSDHCSFDYQKVVTVSIIPKVVHTDSSLKNVDPMKRNCFFDGEKELNFFKIYSKFNCEMECLAKYMMGICNCTSFYHVRDETAPICQLKDLFCLLDKASKTSLRDCRCLERCNLVNYSFEVRSDKLSSRYDSK